MPTLQLTDQQVLDLLAQLPSEQQTALYRRLLAERWQTWEELSRRGQSGVRAAAAARGRDWDAMTDEERDVFIDDVLHEDRPCAG